jgi:hypothetical protein
MYSEHWAKIFSMHLHSGDPVADKVINTVFTEHDISMIDQVFKSLVRNDGVVREHMPALIHDYLDATNDLPEWTDKRLLDIGSDVFDDYCSQIVIILHFVSLPVLYAAGKGVQILTLTGRMTQNIDRRVFETAQFVFYVTDDDAF